jgi:hypothetical protein
MSKKSDLSKARQRLLGGGAVLFLALAVGAAILMNSASYAVTLSYLARDALASQGGATVLAPASRPLVEVAPRVIVPIILGISALHMLLIKTRLKKNYEKGVKDGVWLFRWIHLAITGLLTIELVGLMSGVTDLFTLKLMGGLIIIWALSGWATERQVKDAKKPAQLTYNIGLLAHILAAVPIAASAFLTSLYGLERLGWHLYTLYAVFVISGILLAITQYRHFRQKGSSKDYQLVERNYLAIDLLTKTAFAVILIVAFQN